MKAIIAGSRSITDMDALEKLLKYVDIPISEVVCGMAPGADMLGKAWAEMSGIPVREFPADWKNISHPDALIKRNNYGEYDAKAGLRRNEDMADYADVLLLLWDGESRGSHHMWKAAKDKGLTIYVYNLLTGEIIKEDEESETTLN